MTFSEQAVDEVIENDYQELSRILGAWYAGKNTNTDTLEQLDDLFSWRLHEILNRPAFDEERVS